MDKKKPSSIDNSKMSWQGVGFALSLVVAVGTAVYTYLQYRNNQQQCYADDDYSRAEYPGYYQPPSFSDSRPRRSSEDDDDTLTLCVICREMIGPDDKKLRCGHTFHTKCINKWRSKYAATCPMCRKAI